MSKLLSCTLLLTLSLAAGCCCPPVGSSGGGSSSGRDPSSVTFAFLGGLRCFFGSDDSAKEETRPVQDQDLAKKQQAKSEETDHAAALTIR